MVMLILILLVCAVLWCLPLWIVTNLICWVFHLSFYLSILQAFAICLFISVVKSLLFDKKEDK